MFPSRDLHHEWRQFIADQEPYAFLTLNLLHALPVATLHRLAKDFLNRMQREIDGRNWFRIPPENRLTAMGAVEHPDTNSHIHLALAAPRRYVEFVLDGAAQALWHRCHTHAGQFHAMRVSDTAGLAGYMLKDVHRVEDYDRIFVYAPTVDALRQNAVRGPNTARRPSSAPSRGLVRTR